VGENRNPDVKLDAEDCAELSPDAIREELKKILTSQAFRAAHGQQAFLRYVVEEVIAGRGHQIKESIIGIEAFGRGESFDPRLDPIVRTQAAKLRARLARYYATEGLDDALRIEFRKGSYAPMFRKVGARDMARASAAVEPAADRPAASDAGMVSSKIPSRLNWKIVAVAVAILVLAGSAVTAFYGLRSGWRRQIVAADARSIAVMPFVSLGDLAGDEFLSDGLADELIASLRQVPGLRVVARTSAFHFRGEPMDVRDIGRELHVHTVVVGSIRRDRGHLRVTVQLNSTDDNHHLWSGSYDRDSDDARTVPSEIATAVADVLGTGAPPMTAKALLDPQSLRKQVSTNPAAYRNYLKGLYFWNKLTVEGLELAIQYLEQAIAEDPSFAKAYVALADCYVMAPQVGAALPAEVVSKIQVAASRALELDSTLGDPHFDLAVAAEFAFDWARAEAEFKKGLELCPSNAVGHLWYAKFLALVGRRDEVLIHRRIAAELDPVSPYAVQAIAGYFSVMGYYDEAIRQFSSALTLDPDFGLAHQGLGMAYLLKGMPAQAIDEFRKANQYMSGPRRRALLGWAYALSGKTGEAHQILNDFLEQAGREPFPALAIAQIYIGLGDKDHAFEWLAKAVDQKDLDVTLKWDSPYESLRSDPRFTALLRRMKLV
jgi:TolB-like protein/tetratricopeptide (TPR) repeat protein